MLRILHNIPYICLVLFKKEKMMKPEPPHTLFSNKELLEEAARQLRRGHKIKLLAKGNSMYPFITGGRDTVILQKSARLQTGDIVLAQPEEGNFVLHRIYRIKDEQITLMGDGNLQAQENSRKERIYGTVTEIVRNGRSIDCTSFPERSKAWIWRKSLPFRRYLLAVCRIINPIHDL